jgi:hypothetical protein
MTYVVHERSRQSYMSLMISIMKASGLYMALNDSHQMTSRMEYTNAVREPAMRCPGIHKFRKT